MLDSSSGDALLFKSYTEGYDLIGSIVANTYQWPVTRVVTAINQKKSNGVHEVTETKTLATQVVQIHQMMKTMLTPSNVPIVEPLKVVTDVA